MSIPKCPEKLPENILGKIVIIGELWKGSDINPKFSKNLVEEWDKLIMSWKDDKKMPIIIRKSGGIRGQEIIHKSGRPIIISDNSTSKWV